MNRQLLRRPLLCTLSALWLLTFLATAAAQPAAWRISTDADHGGELVLLGSVHVLRSEDHPLPPLIDGLYEAADVLVFELGADDLDPAQAQLPLAMAAMLPAGNRLADVVSDEVHALTAQRAEELGISAALLEPFKPWMVALTMMELQRNRSGFRAELGVEQQLLTRAVTDSKDVLGLETLEAQIGVFDRLDAGEQQALLEQTLRELDAADDTLHALITHWREGRLDALADDMLAQLQDFPRLRQALIDDRNADWVPKIEALLGDGRRYLVVVGALHLTGERSVIELLEQRGHRITRIGEH